MPDLHPIRVAARRTGLTPDVLRAWEKRYGAISPHREGGRRLYSDEDVDRLLLLRRATLGGRSIGQIASMGTDELREMVEADDRAEQAAPPRARSAASSSRGVTGAADRTAAGFIDECMVAIRALDSADLDRILVRARVALGDRMVAQEVIAPVIQQVGDGWQQGSVRIAEEHLATAALRTFVGEATSRLGREGNGAHLLVTTPSGQVHELGAMLVAAAAAAEGWSVTYLGPDLPAEEIAAASERLGAKAIALSIVHPPAEPRISEELRRLRSMVGGDIPILVGGASASSYELPIREIEAHRLPDIPDLRHALAELRSRAEAGTGGSGATDSPE